MLFSRSSFISTLNQRMELQQEAMLLRSGPFEHIAEMKAEKKGSRRYKMGVQVLADSEK